MNRKVKGILARYSTATFGLLLVAAGVALSVKSDLGTSPISCPPYVLSLWGGLTMGQYTALMHLVFIISQVIMLRKKFRPEYLLQIAAAAVFGLFTDLTLWAVGWIEAGSYIWKFVLMLLSCGITAVGISIEVRARAWMLAGEMTTATIADISGCKFRNVKIFFDSGLVIISALASLILFGNLLGKGELTVIREGTLVSAILTGYLMKFIDPYTERTFGKYLEKYEDNR